MPASSRASARQWTCRSIPPTRRSLRETGQDAAARFAHLDALAERGLLDFAVIDPGSVNFTTVAARADGKPAFTYLNPEAHVRVGLEDAPLGSPIGNVAWVEDAVRPVRAAGGEPTTADDVRRDLAAA